MLPAVLLFLVTMPPALSVPLDQSAPHQAVLDAFSLSAPGADPGLPAPHPTRSLWLTSNELASAGSTGPLTPDADVCIIGSGITGVGAAYHLAQAVKADEGGTLGPLSVVILEARDFCSGATGRNGGHLAPHAFFDFRATSAAFGVFDALRGAALEAHVADELARIVAAHDLAEKVDMVDAGRVNLFFTEVEEAEARADWDAASAAGVDVSGVEWLSKEDTDERYGAAFPAVRIPARNLWPQKLVTALFHLAAHTTPALSLALHTRTPATSIAPAASNTSARLPRRWAVHTPRGAVQCAYVLHATNAHAAHLVPALAGRVVPTRGQIIATRASAALSALTPSGFTANEGFEYWFPRPPASKEEEERPLVVLGGGREVERRLAFALGETDDGVLDGEVGRVLREFLPGVFPGRYAEGAEPEMEWTGIMGFTALGDPFVGPVLDSFDEGEPGTPSTEKYAGQYIAAGYSGHGMPRAFGCADAVARMIAASITGAALELPAWLPRHYLTTLRPAARTRRELVERRAAEAAP